MNTDERLEHCVKIHKLPRDFRFDQKPKVAKCIKKNKSDISMELDVDNSKPIKNKFIFNNSKQKVFVKSCKNKTYKCDESSKMNMDDVMLDLKENLPT